VNLKEHLRKKRYSNLDPLIILFYNIIVLDCIFDQINVASVSIKYFFQKHLKKSYQVQPQTFEW